ncbi:MAG: hypothetical protein NW217_13600 [Hyphomicrobiaceae bacterium]|nr:hypothetical protein [Hyphomicrobiaceae bacterium]
MHARLIRTACLGLAASVATLLGTWVDAQPAAAAPLAAERLAADVASPVVDVARRGAARVRGFGGPRVRGFVGGRRVLRAGPRIRHAGARRFYGGPRRFHAGPRVYRSHRIHRPHRRIYRSHRPYYYGPVVPYYGYRTYAYRSSSIRNYRSCYLPCRDDGFNRNYCRRYCWSHRYW